MNRVGSGAAGGVKMIYTLIHQFRVIGLVKDLVFFVLEKLEEERKLRKKSKKVYEFLGR